MRNRPEFQGLCVFLFSLLLFFSVAFDLEAILTNRTPAKDIQRQRSRAQIDTNFLLKCSTRTYWSGTYLRVRKPQFCCCCSRELSMIQSSLSPGNYFVLCIFCSDQLNYHSLCLERNTKLWRFSDFRCATQFDRFS